MDIRDFIIQKIFRYVPDTIWVQFKYFCKFNRFCNLKDPKTFNEKLQWLKLYYREPSHTRMVDKYEMKDYVTQIIGEGHVIPLIGVWDRVEDVDFDSLPSKFVLKTTHDCAGLVICPDKSKLNINEARERLKKALNSNYYIKYREWPYKNVKPRIIAEKYMVDETGEQLKDYKIFCFNGEPYCIQVDFDRFLEHKKNLYSLEWELLDFSYNYPSHPEISIARPETLDDMLRIARQLSTGEPYVRVDFYSVEGRAYVGEITFFPASGYGKFLPSEYDRVFGDMIHLPEKVLERKRKD